MIVDVFIISFPVTHPYTPPRRGFFLFSVTSQSCLCLTFISYPCSFLVTYPYLVAGRPNPSQAGASNYQPGVSYGGVFEYSYSILVTHP